MSNKHHLKSAKNKEKSGLRNNPLFGYIPSKIKWNFTKFVINKEGLPVDRFGPQVDPIPKVLERCKLLF